MPRPRTPAAKAKAAGADIKNPSRHAGRAAPKGQVELGAPPAWLDAHGRKAFLMFKAELPWLKESHRVLVEMASKLRGRLIDPDPINQLGLTGMQELRRMLAQLGATPADESKVAAANGEEEDPDDGLFSGPAGSRPN